MMISNRLGDQNEAKTRFGDVLAFEGPREEIVRPISVWLRKCRMPSVKKVELDGNDISLPSGSQ